jgi:hypothetical protein
MILNQARPCKDQVGGRHESNAGQLGYLTEDLDFLEEDREAFDHQQQVSICTEEIERIC